MNAESEPAKTARCRVCKEPMFSGAKRCTACKSYQGWRRFFDFSAVVLSLLVALISVLSAAGPKLVALLPPWGSALAVKSNYFSPDRISLIIQNTGNQPGLVGKVTVLVWCWGIYYNGNAFTPEQWKANTPRWGFDVDLGTSPGISRTIPPRSSREIAYNFSRQMLFEWKNGFPKDLPWPDPGDFENALNKWDVRVRVRAELWDYGADQPRTVDLVPSDPKEVKQGAPFLRAFNAVTQTF